MITAAYILSAKSLFFYYYYKLDIAQFTIFVVVEFVHLKKG